MEDAGASRDDIDLSLLQKQTANISVPGSDRFVQEGPIHFYSIDRMQTEEQLTNLLRQLQVTYNTLNEYTKSKSDMIAYVNLEYSKKFIYERIETYDGHFDIMLESKAKDKALLKYLKDYQERC